MAILKVKLQKITFRAQVRIDCSRLIKKCLSKTFFKFIKKLVPISRPPLSPSPLSIPLLFRHLFDVKNPFLNFSLSSFSSILLKYGPFPASFSLLSSFLQTVNSK